MGFGTFQRKKEDIITLRLIIFLEMVEIWICITGIVKLFFYCFCLCLNLKREEIGTSLT